MSTFEVISAIILMIACVFIVVVVLIKDTKTQMSQSISGQSSDSYYQKNAGRTKEAMLNKATIVAAVLFFVLAVAVNLFYVYGKKASADNTSTPAAVTSDTSSAVTSDTSADSASSAASDASSAESDTSSAASESSENSSADSSTSSGAESSESDVSSSTADSTTTSVTES